MKRINRRINRKMSDPCLGWIVSHIAAVIITVASPFFLTLHCNWHWYFALPMAYPVWYISLFVLSVWWGDKNEPSEIIVALLTVAIPIACLASLTKLLHWHWAAAALLSAIVGVLIHYCFKRLEEWQLRKEFNKRIGARHEKGLN